MTADAGYARPVVSTLEPRPVVTVFPFWEQNPYLNMAYLAIAADGFVVARQREYDELLDSIDRRVDGDLVHLHWTGVLLEAARDEQEARERLERFEKTIEAAQARGVLLLWTVHNKLPHELAHPESERALVRFLADRADVVHVLSLATLGEVADVSPIDPAKVELIEHSSYDGFYDSGVERVDAREKLGVGPDETAVLFFGQVRAYKGVDVLIDAFAQASARRDDLTLLVAGRTREEDRAIVEPLLSDGVRAITHFGFVADGAVADWLVGADVMVLPYSSILNSGSMHLASTFGLPVLLPSFPHLVAGYGDQAWVHFYDADGGAEALAEALSVFRASDDDRRAAREYARAYTPWDMANRFLDLYRRLRPRAEAVTTSS